MKFETMPYRPSPPKELIKQYRTSKTWPGGPPVDTLFTYNVATNTYRSTTTVVSVSSMLEYADFFTAVPEFKIITTDGETLRLEDYFYRIEGGKLICHANGYKFKVGKNTPEAKDDIKYFTTITKAIAYLIANEQLFNLQELVVNPIKDLKDLALFLSGDLLVKGAQKLQIPQNIFMKAIRGEEVN